MPDYTRLKSVLLSSGTQHKNPALYQVVDTLLTYLAETQLELDGVIDGGSGGGGGIPDQHYLTYLNDQPVLPNSRQLVAGTGISFNLTSVGLTINSTPSVVLSEGNGDEFNEGMIPGPQGIQGITGLSGRPGMDGDDGIDGERGSPGLIGPTGLTGQVGIPGIDGIDGEDGQIGIPGLRGLTGLTGISGPPGLDGYVDAEIELNLPRYNSNVIGNFTTGSVIFAGNAGQLAQDNANFFWDDTNNRLGIGTASPSRLLTLGTGDISLADITNIYWRNAGGSEVAYVKFTDGDGIDISTNSNISLQVSNNDKIVMNVAGKLGIGATSFPAKVHIVDGAEQLRLGFDASNYNSFTVSSIGSLTIAAVGTNPNIIITPGGTGLFKVSTLTTNGYTKTSSGDGRFSVQAVPIPVADGGSGTTTAFTLGSVIFAGTAGVYSQDNANFFWDDTNNRLGIGTTGPLYKLHVTAGAADVEFSLGPNPGAAGALLFSWFNATTTSRIQSYGGLLAINPLGNNVGIGTSTAPSLLTVNGPVNMKNYTVATLPGATRGDIAYVTDALAPAFLTAIAGGGAVVTPVFYNGAAWVAM